jgi:SWI/SNF chromatin-remodeling complex subunit SWI1
MQPVARVLQHYYQVILGNFEELYRKNVVDQQRKALLMRSGATPQASGGGIGQTPQQAGVNGSLQPGQQDTAGVTNMMSMMGQPISNAQPSGVLANGVGALPLQPPSQSDHQRQPSVTPSMSSTTLNVDGTSSQASVGGYPAQATAKTASEAEQDGQSNKRKLESEEVDIKKARQKTG